MQRAKQIERSFTFPSKKESANNKNDGLINSLSLICQLEVVILLNKHKAVIRLFPCTIIPH